MRYVLEVLFKKGNAILGTTMSVVYETYCSMAFANKTCVRKIILCVIYVGSIVFIISSFGLQMVPGNSADPGL